LEIDLECKHAAALEAMLLANLLGNSGRVDGLIREELGNEP